MNEFNESHVGQPVHCHLLCLDGVIAKCNRKIIEVTFHSAGIARYTLTGVKIGHDERSLTFKNGSIVYDIGTPINLYKELEFMGNPVWCFVGDSAGEVSKKEHPKQQVIAGFDGKYLFISEGVSNTDSVIVDVCEFAMALTDEELEACQLESDLKDEFLK